MDSYTKAASTNTFFFIEKTVIFYCICLNISIYFSHNSSIQHSFWYKDIFCPQTIFEDFYHMLVTNTTMV